MLSPAYTSDPSAADKKERRTGLYGIKAESVGVYEITAIRESNGEKGKVINTEPVNVVYCPSSSWSWVNTDGTTVDAHDRMFDVCVDETVNGEISVTGVAPLTVLYLSKTGASESIQMAIGGETNECAEEDTQIQCKLKQQTVSTLRFPVEAKIETDSRLTMKVARITDGLNNSIEFTSTTGTALPPVNGKGSYIKIDDQKDILQANGHSRPSARYACESTKIRTFYDPQFERPPEVPIPVEMEGVGPFTFGYDFYPETSDSPGQPQLLENVQDHKFGITAREPGVFSITSVRDNFCEGEAKLPSHCKVTPLLPPTLKISTTPIEEACLGNVGANVDVQFTGEGNMY
jgi:hypothetical protein